MIKDLVDVFINFIGIRYVLIGSLAVIILAGVILKITNKFSNDTLWTKETKYLKITKDILLVLGKILLIGLILLYVWIMGSFIYYLFVASSSLR